LFAKSMSMSLEAMKLRGTHQGEIVALRWQ
jgi:hypothetical protein